MNPRAIRTLRGGIAAAVAIQVALLSHVLGGGSAPDILLVGLTFVIAWIACVALAGRRLSLPRLAVSVGLSQFAFHAIFSVLGSPEAGAAVSGHVHAPSVLSAVATASPSAASAGDPDLMMWLAHALAAAITTAALFRGEQAVRAILAPFVVLVRGVVTAVQSAPAAPRRVVPRILLSASDLLTRVGVSSASRRGPPRPALFPAI